MTDEEAKNKLMKARNNAFIT